ncbi:hypothetical protein IFG57_004014 [Salmonella enterica]|nr:hypothetical protein [Salmonella enterica]
MNSKPYPVSVTVHWSESSFFPGVNRIFTYEDFEYLAGFAAMQAGQGYVKTKVTVLFSDGFEFKCRLDLCQSMENFKTYVMRFIDFSKTERGKLYLKKFNGLEKAKYITDIYI